MNAFHFPQPGERQNAAAIPVPEELLVNVVALAVQATHDLGCTDDECPDCDNNRESCAWAFSLLSSELRDVVDAFLKRDAHINPGDWRR